MDPRRHAVDEVVRRIDHHHARGIREPDSTIGRFASGKALVGAVGEFYRLEAVEDIAGDPPGSVGGKFRQALARYPQDAAPRIEPEEPKIVRHDGVDTRVRQSVRACDNCDFVVLEPHQPGRQPAPDAAIDVFEHEIHAVGREPLGHGPIFHASILDAKKSVVGCGPNCAVLGHAKRIEPPECRRGAVETIGLEAAIPDAEQVRPDGGDHAGGILDQGLGPLPVRAARHDAPGGHDVDVLVAVRQINVAVARLEYAPHVAIGQIGGVGEIREPAPVEVGCALRQPDPESASARRGDGDGGAAREPFLGGVDREFQVAQLAHAFKGADPETALGILEQRSHHIAGEAVRFSQHRELSILEATEAGALRAGPEHALPIHEQHVRLQIGKRDSFPMERGVVMEKAAIRCDPEVSRPILHDRVDVVAFEFLVGKKFQAAVFPVKQSVLARAEPDPASGVLPQGDDGAECLVAESLLRFSCHPAAPAGNRACPNCAVSRGEDADGEDVRCVPPAVADR